MKLPREVIWVVLSYIGHKSFNKSRRVCRQWKQIIDSADFRAFYARFQAHRFSEYTISMFDEFVDELEIPASNWNMKESNATIPPATSLDLFFAPTVQEKSTQLDQHFPTVSVSQLSNHPSPRSYNSDEWMRMMKQRELCKTQKYGTNE